MMRKGGISERLLRDTTTTMALGLHFLSARVGGKGGGG